MPTNSTDLYQILGLERSASAEEIKHAYRKLARQFHPDVSSEDDAEQHFKEVSLAYEVLSDPDKRRQYDQFGTTGGASDHFGGAGFGNLSDIFDFFFGGGGFAGATQARRRPDYATGEDIQRAVHIKLLDCLEGKRIELAVARQEPCATCDGSRSEPGSKPETCETCGGMGMVTQIRDTLLGRMQTSGVCPSCRGAGLRITDPCHACHGRGFQLQHRTIEVQIPPGVDDNMILRVGGQGHSGRGGAPSGDLLVGLSVEPDPRFTRHGADLLTQARVHFGDLSLGATIEVPTLTGSHKLRIPAGTESHARFNLRSEGLPRLRGGGRGTLVVETVVDVPRKLGRRQRELLDELRKLDGRASEDGAEVDSTAEVAEPKANLFSALKKGRKRKTAD